MAPVTEHKFLFTGTMGAGKTTAIAAVSEIAPIMTDVANSDSSVGKARTTVGLDYGEFTLHSGEKIKLYGTPGQARFSFMWDILAKGALGVIILIDNSRPDPLADLDMYLRGFAKTISHTPFVVGVGRTEAHQTPSLDDFAAKLEAAQLVAPVIPVDVRQSADVVLLIELVLTQLESSQQ